MKAEFFEREAVNKDGETKRVEMIRLIVDDQNIVTRTATDADRDRHGGVYEKYRKAKKDGTSDKEAA